MTESTSTKLSDDEMKVIKEKYLNKSVSFKSDKGDANGIVTFITAVGELRIKEKEEGFSFVGLPEDVELVEDSDVGLPEDSSSSDVKEETTSDSTPASETKPVEGGSSTPPETETPPEADVNDKVSPETVIPEEELEETDIPHEEISEEVQTSEKAPDVSSEVETSDEKPNQETLDSKKSKDQILAEILIRDGGGTVESLSAELHEVVGGSLKVCEIKVKALLPFLVYLGAAEVDDDLYVLTIK